MSRQEYLPARGLPKVPPLVLWTAATLVIGIVFILASAPSAQAQSNAQNTQRYSTNLQYVFDYIQRHYVDEVDPKVVFEGAVKGMFNALEDPYSAFLPETEMSDMNETTQGNFGGVGLYINAGEPQYDGTMKYVEVAAPMEDTPGWRAGLNPLDRILEIDGESTDGLTMDDVLARLRGPPGQPVTVLVGRGETLEFPVTIIREVIEVPTTKFAMIGDAGYLKLLTFTPMTAERAREALAYFETNNYQSLILDLRNNYGGLLQSAVEICELFLDSGLVVSTRSRIASENMVFGAHSSALVPAGIPVIVLINRGSASASEIVAGALKDRGRAYLVGERSYGKGSVQKVYALGSTGFKLTTARYYTPSDVNIDKIGIPPDQEVKYPDFTEEDAVELNRLLQSNKIPEFITEYPDAGSLEISGFAQTLKQDYKLDLDLLRRYIRSEQIRKVIAPVYDLEYDIQLQGAVNILKSGTYSTLMRDTKTLKTLQEEAAQEEEFAQAS
ncbi:MAG: S41 family peptidase [Treponema sp.]|jgi:carboxyl-terminal processing protease|nr:S41 family peptidase [Treponema sp.]